MCMKLKCAAAAYSCIIISSRLPLKHSSLTGYLQTNFDKIQPGFSSNRSVVVTHDGKNGIDESNLINIKTKTNPSVRRAKQLLINIHLCLPLGILLEIKLLAAPLYISLINKIRKALYKCIALTIYLSVRVSLVLIGFPTQLETIISPDTTSKAEIALLLSVGLHFILLYFAANRLMEILKLLGTTNKIITV